MAFLATSFKLSGGTKSDGGCPSMICGNKGATKACQNPGINRQACQHLASMVEHTCILECSKWSIMVTMSSVSMPCQSSLSSSTFISFSRRRMAFSFLESCSRAETSQDAPVMTGVLRLYVATFPHRTPAPYHICQAARPPAHSPSAGP